MTNPFDAFDNILSQAEAGFSQGVNVGQYATQKIGGFVGRIKSDVSAAKGQLAPTIYGQNIDPNLYASSAPVDLNATPAALGYGPDNTKTYLMIGAALVLVFLILEK